MRRGLRFFNPFIHIVADQDVASSHSGITTNYAYELQSHISVSCVSRVALR